jgi:hypothetical protein
MYLTTAKELTVSAKRILSQWFGQSVSNLIIGADGKDLDETFPHVLTKVMVARVDVLRARTELGQTSEFEGTGVVLEYLAVNNWLVADDFVATAPHLVKQFHNRDDVSKSCAESDVFCLGGRQSHLSLKPASEDYGASHVEYDPSTS